MVIWSLRGRCETPFCLRASAVRDDRIQTVYTEKRKERETRKRCKTEPVWARNWNPKAPGHRLERATDTEWSLSIGEHFRTDHAGSPPRSARSWEMILMGASPFSMAASRLASSASSSNGSCSGSNDASSGRSCAAVSEPGCEWYSGQQLGVGVMR